MNINLFNSFSFVDKINEFFEPLKQIIVKYHGNPVFWMILLVIGIGTFFMTYGALHGPND